MSGRLQVRKVLAASGTKLTDATPWGAGSFGEVRKGLWECARWVLGAMRCAREQVPATSESLSGDTPLPHEFSPLLVVTTKQRAPDRRCSWRRR